MILGFQNVLQLVFSQAYIYGVGIRISDNWVSRNVLQLVFSQAYTYGVVIGISDFPMAKYLKSVKRLLMPSVHGSFPFIHLAISVFYSVLYK